MEKVCLERENFGRFSSCVPGFGGLDFAARQSSSLVFACMRESIESSFSVESDATRAYRPHSF